MKPRFRVILYTQMKRRQSKMKIREVSKQLSLPISTLHYYERIGLVTPERGKNNYRCYSEEDYNDLILISIMREFGFSIQEIKEVMERYTVTNPTDDLVHEARDFFKDKIIYLEEKIQEYQDLIQIINTLPILSENPLDWNDKKERTMVLASHLYEKVRE
ncbi:MerR family transcriptional regulator [bacterium 1XD42-8]|nr:MerR family transcriptional regulator [bacterium 1XD42-8]